MTRSLRVLLIEDSENDALLIEDELKRNGFNVEYERVKSAGEMIDALFKTKWDVIISDYNLPGFSGKEALEILKNNGSGVPFIVVSGIMTEDTAVDMIKGGAANFVMKSNLQRLPGVIEKELKKDGIINNSSEDFRNYRSHLENIIEERNFELEDCNKKLKKEIAERKKIEKELIVAKKELEIKIIERTEELANINEELRVEIEERTLVEQELQRHQNNLEDLVKERTEELNKLNRQLEFEISEKKKGELRLRVNELKYRTLFEQAPNGVFIASIDGKLIDANSAYAHILGYDSINELKKNVKDLAFDVYANPEERYDIVRQLKSGLNQVTRETVFKRNDGSHINVDITLKSIYDEEGNLNYNIGHVVDITEINETRSALQESEERFRFAIRNIPIVLFNMDRNLRYTWAYNPQIQNADELLKGKTDFDFFSKEDADKLTEIKRKTLETGKSSREVIKINYSGRESWFDLTVEPVWDDNLKVQGITCVTFDVTERVNSAHELWKSEEEYRNLAESVNSIIMRWKPDGTLVYMNDFGLNFFGYNDSEIFGKDVSILLPDLNSQGQDLKHLVTDIVNKPDDYRNVENENIIRTGEIVTISWSNRAITDTEGRVVEILAVGNDITPLKRAEEELKKLNDHLEQLVKEKTVELEDTLDELVEEVSERLKAQEDLKEAFAEIEKKEEEYRNLVENTPDIIVLFDKDFKCLYISPTIEKESGLTQEFFSGKKINDLGLDSKQVSIFNQYLTNVLETGNKFSYEAITNGKESKNYYYVTFSPQLDDKGNPEKVLAVIRNITELRIAQEELRKKDELYRALVEKTPDIISLYDKEMRYVYVNSAIERLQGIKVTDLIGKTNTELEVEARLVKKWENDVKWVFKHSREKSDEIELQHIDSIHWYNVSFVPIFDDNGRVVNVLTISRDFTELKKKEDELQKHRDHLEELVAEQTEDLKLTNDKLLKEIEFRKKVESKLRDSEERFRLALRNSPITVISMDRELRYTWVYNPLLGFEAKNLIGKTDFDVLDDKDAAARLMSIKRVPIDSGETIRNIFWFDIDGRRYYYDVYAEPLKNETGEITGVAAVVIDITKLKEYEEAIKESEERFRFVLNNSPTTVSTMDKDLRYTWIQNPKGKYKETDVLGKTDFEILPEENARKLTEIKRLPLQTGKPHREIYSYVNRGRKIYIDVYVEPIFNEKQEITGISIITSDITQLKEFEEEASINRSRLEIAIKNTPIVVFQQDINLKYVWVYNSRLHNENKYIGHDDTEMMKGENGKRLHAVKKRVIDEGIPVSTFFEMNLPDGKKKHYSLILEPLKNEDGSIAGLMGSSFDITNIKEIEEDQRIKDAAISSAINGIAIADLDGKITYVNKACLDMWGYDDVSGILGTSLLNYLEQGFTSVKEITENLSENKGWIGELSAVKRDGSLMTLQASANMVFDEEGKPTCMMASFIDISDKKRIEEALKESERRYRILFEQAPNGIFLSTIEGTFLDVNPAYAKMLGYGNSAEIMKSIRDIGKDVYADPAKRQEILELVRKSPDYVRTEVQYKTRDGRIIDVLVTIKSITDPLGRPAYLIGHAEDITEQKEAEKNRYLLSAIVESSENAIFSSDIDGIVLSWNNAARKMYGYTPEEIIGKSVYTIIPPDKKSETDTLLEIMRKGGFLEQYETTRVRKDGAIVPVSVLDSPIKDTSGNIIGFSFIGRDLTEVKKAEMALRESMERLRIALKNTPITVFTQDRNLKFTWVYHPVMNFNAEELLGKTDADILLPDEAEFYMALKRKVIETGESIREEVTATQADGKKFIFDFTGEPLRDEDGKIIGITCATIDITDKIEHEQEKKRQEVAQVLEKSARLASVGVLAGGITHEINQPLNAIRMGSDGILLWNKRNKSVLPDIITDMLNGVSSACKRIDEIIHNMRSLWTGLHQENMQLINLNEAASRSVSLLHQKLSNHAINFEIKLPEESLYITANELQIELVLNNLVVNSIYSVDKARTKGKQIKMEVYTEDKYACIRVDDNGLGLPDVSLDKLCDPFFTTKPPEEGSGLGLAIVRMFVTRFEGKLEAGNNNDGGASFILKFPRKKLVEEHK